MHKAARRPGGFTLVEVLVALFVMALMAALAWRGVDGVLRGRDAGRDAIDRTVLLATVMSQWQTDLQSLHDDSGTPTLTFDGRTLRLVRKAEGGVQLVAWSLYGRVWQRWTSEVTTRQADLQQAWLRSQQLQGNEPGQVRLLEGVSTWQAQRQFAEDNAWTNFQSTGDLQAVTPSVANAASAASAPASNRNTDQLPLAVRVILTIDGKTLTRDIMIAAAS